MDAIPRRRVLMVAILVIGGFATLLNQTVMTPALPSIMHDFNIKASDAQWLTSIFLLVNGIMVPITAYLISRFRTRTLFILAMSVFMVGTVVCAISNTFLMLLLGRVVQAVGAGVMMPFVPVVIMTVFPKERRGFALGIVGVVFGVSPAAGPTFGGVLVDLYDWHYIFLLVLPIGAASILLGLILLKNVGERSAPKLDWFSVFLSCVGFGGLLYGFSSAGTSGWTAPQTLIGIIVGAVVVALFIRRQVNRDEPLLNFRVFRNPKFKYGMSVTSIIAMAMTVGAVITPIFAQDVIGMTAVQTGLIFVPGALIMAALSPVTGILFDRYGPRALCIIGCSIVCVGTGMLAFMGETATFAYICFAYSFRMVGISLVNMPANTWALNALKDESIAHGNAIITTARQVFGSIGTAILVTVMVLVAGMYTGLGSKLATAHGIEGAFAAATGLAVVALIIAIVKIRR